MTIRALWLPLIVGGMAMCASTAPSHAQQPAATQVGTTVAATEAKPADVALISVDDTRKRLDAKTKVVFVDARSAISGDMVKGAVHVPFESVDAWAKDVSKETTIVTYCACPTDGGAKAVAARLTALGFKNVFALQGGIGAWKTAGMPTEVFQASAK